MNREVADRIRRAIRERGPITFSEYMREALYGVGGFFERNVVGAGGHFVTSPHVHPVFSRLVGAALERLWEEMGSPRPLRLVEVGAGDGTMAAELVDGFARAGIPLVYEAVEVSETARDALAAITPSTHERLTDVEPIDPGLVVANEVLDNLPFRRARRRDGTVLEVRVGIEHDRFIEVETPWDADPSTPLPAFAGDGDIVVPTGAFAFVEELASRLRSGYALLIDYGVLGSPAGEVHAYRDHRVMAGVLTDPGSADITAGVDLAAVSAHAERFGLVAFEPVRQHSALAALGFEEWMRAELSRQGDLLNADRGLDAVRAWEGRNRARLLVDPAALGRLHWLVLATPALTEPDWLRRARRLSRPD